MATQTAADLWAKVRGSFVQEQEEEEQAGLLASLNEATTLNRTQRLYGFLICFGMSVLFSLLSLLTFFPIFHPTKFGVMYTFSNILALVSTMFLMGPMAQLKRMFDKGRWIATAVYLASLLITLMAAYVVRVGLLVLICLLFQLAALAWYSLSYIPFARQAVSGVLGWASGDTA